MALREYVRRTRLPHAAERVFAWHARSGALERLTPPFAPARVVERSGRGIDPGARVVLRIPIGPVGVRWIAEHRDLEPGRMFRDVMVAGPFAAWDHTHRFVPDGAAASVLEDRIAWSLPGGAMANAIAGGMVERMLDGMFAHRHRVTAADLDAHRGCEEGRAASVAVTGASGLVGSALVPYLTTGAHRVVRLVRRPVPAADNVVWWDPVARTVETDGLEELDAVVHLAGESVAGGRWTSAVKTSIRDSRIAGTHLLAETLARLERPPRVLVCASAIGFYGDRGDAVLDESAGPGAGFLADVCRAWELAAEPARQRGIRVVHLRLGVVLTPLGGALARLLPPFRAGLGGPVGPGTQWMSWVAIDDVLDAIHHVIVRDDVAGAVNVVAPEPVTNREFGRTLGRVLHRPAVLPLPAAATRVAFGEMADAMLLASTRAVPARLSASGFAFREPTLEGALRHLLGA